jgi:LacI family transcriptional regulator
MGYRDALLAAGLEEDPSLVVSGNRDAAAAQVAVERLLGLPDKRRPTAIFAANNRNTVGALHALAARGRPVALVGFDDFELADVVGTTVVHGDPWRLGEQAAALAFARLDGDERPPRQLTVPTRLIVRGSGEIAP